MKTNKFKYKQESMKTSMLIVNFNAIKKRIKANH